MDYLSSACSTFYYFAYPIFYILKLLLSVLVIITAPLLHLGHYCLYACWYALSALGKFETLYIFFGVAALVGIVTGTSLHYVSGFIMSMLNLESSPEEQRGRPLSSNRAEKQERLSAKNPKMKVVQTDESHQGNELSSRKDQMNWYGLSRDRRLGGNRFYTILEEENSSDGF